MIRDVQKWFAAAAEPDSREDVRIIQWMDVLH
jgi:hypothetical protein